jgi:hypothetical protein
MGKPSSGTVHATSDILEVMANAYVAFLAPIKWDHHWVLRGSAEGRGKFLSNTYLAVLPGRDKYKKTQFLSEEALTRLRGGSSKGLECEHLVPKTTYFQVPCEELARTGGLTTDFVLQLLRQYWVLAMVTKEEHRRLKSRSMPENWDRVNVLARYAVAGITVVPNPFALVGVPPYALPDQQGRQR